MRDHLFVQLAKQSIESAFADKSIDTKPYLDADPALAESGASFVTLTMGGGLRGCIGSIIAHRPLIDDIIANARSAAFHDPRFTPLSQHEYSSVHVEVSILTPPQPIDYRDEEELRKMIRPGIDGVILKLNGYQATFLPQVWDEIKDFDTFFAHLGLKAGIGNNPLAYHPDVYTYQVEKYS